MSLQERFVDGPDAEAAYREKQKQNKEGRQMCNCEIIRDWYRDGVNGMLEFEGLELTIDPYFYHFDLDYDPDWDTGTYELTCRKCKGTWNVPVRNLDTEEGR